MSAENANFTRLQTPGGGQVAARLFEPDRAPSMQVVVGAAMGVPQRRYAEFAGWLAGQGVQVVIAGGMGRRALDLFAENKIAVHGAAAADSTEALVRAFLDQTLGNTEPTCGHDHTHDHAHCQSK